MGVATKMAEKRPENRPVNRSDELSDDVLVGLSRKFRDELACWCATVRPNGRVHLAPIWHVVYNNLVYMVTRSSSVRARNIAANDWVSLCLPDPVNALIIEGRARPAPEREAEIQPLFMDKYGWDISTDLDYELILEMTPVKVMAWGNHGEGRWRYDEERGYVRIR